MSKFLIAKLFFLIFMLLNSIYGFSIKTTVSGKEKIIYENNKVTDAFIPNRTDYGICKPVRRLFLGENTYSHNFTIYNIQNMSQISSKIHYNSNNEICEPNIQIFPNNNKTMNAILSFNCKYVNYDSKNSDNIKPWTFTQIEIQDKTENVIFEILKTCNEDFYKKFDWSIILLFSMVMFVVGLSSRVKNILPNAAASDQEIENIVEQARTDLKYWHIFIFVGVASIILTLAFFFTETLLQIFTVGLCISGVTLFGFYICQFMQFILKSYEKLWKCLMRKILFGDLVLAELIGYCLSISLIISWLITRNWVLNNLIGIFYVACFLRIIKVNSMIVSSVMLGLLFVYDIFWVFYSDRFFGSNVMLSVATQFDLPIKLLMPHINELPSSQCMLIGLGDLVVPGLVIAYAYRVSLALNTKWYYIMGITGYFIAILICEIMLIIYEQAQPALLYISPAMMIFMCGTAVIRKEFLVVWNGSAVKSNDRLLEKNEENKNN